MAVFRNSGESQSDIFQNRITKYLMKYIRGRRYRYIKNLTVRTNNNELAEDVGTNCINDEVFMGLPVLEQIGDDKLYAVLSEIGVEGLQIILLRVERGLTFEEIADELNSNAVNVRKKYNRLITLIRKEIGYEFY